MCHKSAAGTGCAPIFHLGIAVYASEHGRICLCLRVQAELDEMQAEQEKKGRGAFQNSISERSMEEAIQKEWSPPERVCDQCSDSAEEDNMWEDYYEAAIMADQGRRKAEMAYTSLDFMREVRKTYGLEHMTTGFAAIALFSNMYARRNDP